MHTLLEPDVWQLTKIVIPRIKAEWKDVALSMGYGMHSIKAIKMESEDLKESCQNLFTSWLETDHGPTPKSWRTLLSKIKEVDNLKTVAEEIEMELFTSKFIYEWCCITCS